MECGLISFLDFSLWVSGFHKLTLTFSDSRPSVIRVRSIVRLRRTTELYLCNSADLCESVKVGPSRDANPQKVGPSECGMAGPPLDISTVIGTGNYRN